MNRALRFSWIALLVAATILPAMPARAAAAEPNVAGAAGGRRDGRYWYFVDNLTAQPGQPASVTLWAALPLERPGQHVTIGEIVPPPADIVEDPVAGNRVVLWVVKNPPAGAPLVFHYDFTIENSPVSFDIDPQKVRPAPADSPEARRFTISEPWIEITPEIAAKAREIVGRETNSYRQARLIFDWTVENITYDYPAIAQRGAVKCFPRRRGDCGEFSHIFVALLRSLGVPARCVAANWFQGGGHMWAEVFLPPYGWVPADTSGAQVLKNGLKGEESEAEIKKFMDTRGVPTRDPAFLFGHLYPNRVEVFIGENIAFESKKTGLSRTFYFMQPGGANAWPSGVTFDGLSGKTVHVGFFTFDQDRADQAKAWESAQDRLAEEYAGLGAFDKALPLLQRALQKNPDDHAKLFTLGKIYFNQKRYEEAIAALQRSAAGEGGGLKRTADMWAHLIAGMAYDALHKPDLAVAEYDKALAIGADYEDSLATAKKLRAEHYHPDDGASKK